MKKNTCNTVVLTSKVSNLIVNGVMPSCRRHFDETKYMFFPIKNIELLEKHNEI